jgi:thioredoxin reductase
LFCSWQQRRLQPPNPGRFNPRRRQVSGVTLVDTVSGSSRELAVTGVFVAIGHDPRNELIAP